MQSKRIRSTHFSVSERRKAKQEETPSALVSSSSSPSTSFSSLPSRKRLTSNVALLSPLLSEPLSEDVVHGGRRESDGEGELGVVSRHGGDVEVLGEGDFHGRRGDSKDLNDLSNSVGSVVEEEEGVVVCSNGKRGKRRGEEERRVEQKGRQLEFRLTESEKREGKRKESSPLILLSAPPTTIGFKNSSVTSFL